MRRVILLGASNLTLSLPLLSRSLQSLDTDLQMLVADGHGRGYALSSRFLATVLPAIPDCGLWARLADLPSVEHPPWALVGDVGNDLPYGASPRSLTRRVGQCLERLAEYGAESSLMLPPGQSVAGLSAARYYLIRSLFFPGSRLGPQAAREAIVELEGRLRELAGACGVPVVEPPRDWYGVDPVHFRRNRRRQAWCAAVEAGGELAGARADWIAALRRVRTGPRAAWTSWRCRRASFRYFGRARHASQPARSGPGFEFYRY